MDKKSNIIRYRLNVPEEDQIVTTWMENQSNRHLAIRLLIKQYVAKHGDKDVFENYLDNYEESDNESEVIEDINSLEEVEPELPEKQEIDEDISEKELENQKKLERLQRMQGMSNKRMTSMQDLLNN